MCKRVPILTAGGSGGGAAAVRRLAQDGFKVAVLSLSGKGEALAHELGGFGRYALAEEGAGYITGQNIRVDGGVTRAV